MQLCIGPLPLLSCPGHDACCQACRGRGCPLCCHAMKINAAQPRSHMVAPMRLMPACPRCALSSMKPPYHRPSMVTPSIPSLAAAAATAGSAPSTTTTTTMHCSLPGTCAPSSTQSPTTSQNLSAAVPLSGNRLRAGALYAPNDTCAGILQGIVTGEIYLHWGAPSWAARGPAFIERNCRTAMVGVESAAPRTPIVWMQQACTPQQADACAAWQLPQ